jgi:uncharacterized cupredoxin-like copper-binding protein
MKRLAIAAPALLVIAIAGCGSDNGNSAEEGAAPRGPAGTQTINVIATEFKLDPSDPTVKKGVVAFKVTNDGKVAHSLEVHAPSGEVELDRALRPGQSGTLEVNMSRAGRYEWYCPIDGHKASGMEGEITVADGRSGGGGGGSPSEDDSGGGVGY